MPKVINYKDVVVTIKSCVAVYTSLRYAMMYMLLVSLTLHADGNRKKELCMALEYTY